jgi:hypothetical protein
MLAMRPPTEYSADSERTLRGRLFTAVATVLVAGGFVARRYIRTA